MDSSPDWQKSKHQVVQRGKYLFETGELSDCKFIVGQEPQQQVLKGHKLYLATSSPVFKAMFYGNIAEKTDPIPIPDVQPDTFKNLLKYIYTDEVDLRSFELVRDLCYCAKKYMLPYLVEQCTIYLRSNVSPNTACNTYEFAKLLEEPTLMEKCLSIIRTMTTTVLNASSWEEVQLDTLLTILELNELTIDSEMKLFTAVERWAKAECTRKLLNPSDTECLRSVIGNALSKIRFLTLTPQQFAEGIHRSLFLTKDEAFTILMNVTLSGRNIPMSKEFSISSVHRKPTAKPTGKPTAKPTGKPLIYCSYCNCHVQYCQHCYG